jgi:DHA1 family inner membrane transport protein
MSEPALTSTDLQSQPSQSWADERPHGERNLLWALLFGNFVIGTGILLPAGMLSDIALAFDVSIPSAGTLMLVSGVVVAIGAPLIAAVTSHIDRRRILVVSMLLYAVCHAISAIAPTFEILLAARFALAISAAIFTPQAAATLSALLPPERRSAAITMVFVGWSLATVGGMPLGGYIAHAWGWQAAFGIVAVMSLMAAFAVWRAVPGMVIITPLTRAWWRRVLSNPAMLHVLLVTVLNGTGQFTFFTYLNPSLRSSLLADVTLVTVILAWYGVSATIGNVVVSRLVTGLGASRSAHLTLLSMSIGMIIWGFGAHLLWAVLLAASLWGVGTFAANSIQQARLAAIDPNVTSASVALNTSAIYLGQAAGSGLGGAMINAHALAYLPWAGAAILLMAVAFSLVAQSYESQAATARRQ